MDNQLARKIREAAKQDGYLITVTDYNSKRKGAELRHWYITHNFPRQDIKPSMKEMSKLIVQREGIQLSTSHYKKEKKVHKK